MATREKYKEKDKKKKKRMEKIQKTFSVPHVNPEEIVLKGLLGKGCFGKVYLGECRSVEVAVKVPKKQELSKRALRNFCKEVEIMSKIYHPNVCLFMGACTSPGNIRIIQEKLCGDLESRIHNLEEEITLSQRMQWAKDASQGLAWLHGNNPPIIHRDLKPANMLYDEHGRIKVCDFGLSHFMEEGITDREPKGTPLYMAPEVMRKQEITEKVDVYSMGIIMWELLTREDPFAQHEDYDEFVDSVCNGGERPVIPEWCPDSLRALIVSCWATNPDDRPTFPEMVTALDDVLEDAAVLEYEEQVDTTIADAAGRYLWKKHFTYKEEVSWHAFATALYAILDKTPPASLTTALTVDATEDDLRHVSAGQLEDYSKLSPSCAALANAEKQRRALTANQGPLGYMMQSADVILDNDTRTLLALKSVVADNEAETVTMKAFGRLLGWFGPLEVPHQEGGFLDRIEAVLQEPWFHGNVNARNTENLLRVQAPGTFLIRFSSSHKNSFCISKVSANKVIKHIVVPFVATKGFKIDNQFFPTLPAMVDAKADSFFLKYSCPGSKYTWLFETDVAGIGGYGVDENY